MIKALNPNFKSRIIPLITETNAQILDHIIFPIYMQGLPKGVSIFIRSGVLQFSYNNSIKNIALKGILSELIRSSRKLKITIEAIVTFDYKILNTDQIIAKLLDYEDNGDNLKIVINDIVFEHSPDIMDFSIREKSIKSLFKNEITGEFSKIIDSCIINNREEFEMQLLAYQALGYETYRIISPRAKYNFGNINNSIFEGDIVDIKSSTKFKGKLLKIIPKIITMANKDTYIASILQIQYKNSILDIELKEESVILASKIWENRNSLINNNVIFSGIILPKYTYPKIRNFIRFEKII